MTLSVPSARRRPRSRQLGHRRPETVWGERLDLLASALQRPVPTSLGTVPETPQLTVAHLPDVLGRVVRCDDPREVWLALAVLTGSIPSDRVVARVARESEFTTPGSALAGAVVCASTDESLLRNVEVLPPGTVTVDVSATLRANFVTGIQRVVRETAFRWERDYGAVPVAWTPDFTALRRLTPLETDDIRMRARHADSAPTAQPPTVVVPWQGTFVEPEVLAELGRSVSVRSLAQFARCRTVAISHDCIPITFSETLIDWFHDTFGHHLTAMREFDQLVPVSAASAAEHRGWRRALSGAGRIGPEIDVVPLPFEVPPSTPDDLEAARRRFVVDGLSTVLVVGSSEPRKNHLAILYAAEVLWRRGHRFCLTFIGGRAWGTDLFARKVEELAAAGRPVDVATGVSDTQLAAAYRVSRFTVFPSLAEGFGLPAAESLACGTPTVTSDFGSMKEIAAGGGALEVNPRKDAEIVEAMERLLCDDALLARLRAEAAGRPVRTWDMYAAEVWRLVEAD